MVELEPGEQVVVQTAYQPESTGRSSLTCVWTDRNVYWSRVDFVTGATKFDRIPHANIRRVVVSPVRRIGAWIAAPFLVLIGGALSFIMFLQPYLAEPGETYRVSGWPLALFVGGLALPFVARYRYEVRLIVTSGRSRRWRMPIVFGSKAREGTRRVLDSLVLAAEETSLHLEKPEDFAPLEGGPTTQ